MRASYGYRAIVPGPPILCFNSRKVIEYSTNINSDLMTSVVPAVEISSHFAYVWERE